MSPGSGLRSGLARTPAVLRAVRSSSIQEWVGAVTIVAVRARDIFVDVLPGDLEAAPTSQATASESNGSLPVHQATCYFELDETSLLCYPVAIFLLRASGLTSKAKQEEQG